MVRTHKRRKNWSEKAWNQYSAEFPPPPGYAWTSRRLFNAGYVRGRASVLGLAWLYCTLVTVIMGLFVVVAILWG